MIALRLVCTESTHAEFTNMFTIHALQDECRDHVGREEMRLRTELQHALQCQSDVVHTTARHLETACDQHVQESLQHEAQIEDLVTNEELAEMTALQQKLHEQGAVVDGCVHEAKTFVCENVKGHDCNCLEVEQLLQFSDELAKVKHKAA